MKNQKPEGRFGPGSKGRKLGTEVNKSIKYCNRQKSKQQTQEQVQNFLAQEENQEQKEYIEKKFSELYTLKNKVNRYGKRLLKEGLNIGKEQNLDFILDGIENENINVQPIIKLAEKTHPALSRKFYNLREAYQEKLKELERIVENYR